MRRFLILICTILGLARISHAGIIVNGNASDPVRDTPAQLDAKSYVYISSEVAAAATITLTGTGSRWSVTASSGPITFQISGGSTITVLNNGSVWSDFKLIKTNPSIRINTLGAGAKAEVFMDGGN